MIKKIHLKNYRVYKDEVIDFDDLKIIKGRNGKGKTTIVEAIGFALFGSSLQRGKSGSWVKLGEKKGEVKLYIDDFIITRSTTKALVEDLNGNVLAKNNVGIVEWVEREYGLNAELFKTSFYIGQKEIGAFAALSPMERTKRVEKLLRIDKLDAIKSLAKEKAVGIQGSLNVYTSKLENADYSEVRIIKLEEESVSLKDKLSKQEAKLEKLLVAQGEYRSQLASWRTKQNLVNAYKGVEYDLEKEEKAYSKLIEENAQVEQANKLVREKIALERKLASVNVLEKYFKCNIRELLNQETSYKTYKKLKRDYDEFKKSGLEPREHDLEELSSQLKTSKKVYSLNKDIPDICPTCKQSWPTKVEVDLDKLQKDIKAQAAAYLDALEEQKFFDAKQALEAHQLPELSEDEIAIAIESLENKDSFLKLLELKDVPKELQTQKDLFDIGFIRSQNSLAKRLKELEDIKEPEVVTVEPVKEDIVVLKQELKQVDESLQRQRTAKAIHQEFQGLKDEAEESLDLLKSFIKFIDQYRKAFGSKIIPLINKNVSTIVSYLSEGKYETVKINPDYSIADFDFYSGSEQDSISFALRLAIAQVSRLGKFKTMILDEIAASFDDQKEKLLMDILKQQSNQLIYITHGDL